MMRIVLAMATMGFLFTFITAAQGMHPMVLEAALDTFSQKSNPVQEKIEKTQQSEMKDKECCHDFKCGPWEKMQGRQHGEWGEWHGPMAQGLMFHPSIRRFFLIPAMLGLACLFIMFLVNILLTILVSLDMAHRHQFYGLWIPILLLMGIPGTGLYALFRIGDIIKEKEQKT
jgi:hypothetical protein